VSGSSTVEADAEYVIGDFDARKFIPDHEGKRRVHDGVCYASQTFENAPDGRRIQIGWARPPMPGMPFNQAFRFPHEWTLRKTAEGTHVPSPFVPSRFPAFFPRFKLGKAS
jgi:fructan beta-fructosidase